MITRPYGAVPLLELKTVIGVNFQVEKVPLAVERHETEHASADFQRQRVRPEGAPLRSLRQSQPVNPDFLDVHILLTFPFQKCLKLGMLTKKKGFNRFTSPETLLSQFK